MDHGLFAYILKYSKRQQIALLCMIVISFPFYYLSLDLPKTIINDAISGTEFPVDLSIEIAGFTANFGTFEQVPYLLILCFAFLLLVLINSGFKLVVNIYRGVLGERMLRRLRFQLIDRIMKFPLARFRTTGQGELVSMVNQETEPLGGFIGEAFSLPFYQGGLLLTILVFMFVQDWKLGLAAIALYPVQAWLIPKLQKQVNLLNQERTIRLRKLADNLGELVAGINEIHVNDNSTFFKDHFSKKLGGIFTIRVQIYKLKFFIKFLNNSIAQLTPFFFFLVGGLLVIRGELSVGALVAALAAYKDLSPPWKELLAWYQGQADARLKFSILTEQFRHIDEEPESKEKFDKHWLEGIEKFPIVADNVGLKSEDGIQEISNVSLTINSGEWIGLIGSGNSGKNHLAQMFARLVNPTSGRLMIAEQNAMQLPKMITGRTVGYVSHDSYLFAGTIRDNVLLSLKYKPQETTQKNLQQKENIKPNAWLVEARLSGNSEIDLDANWVDRQAVGATESRELTERIGEILRTVEAEGDLVRSALARHIDPSDCPELTQHIVQARELFKERAHFYGYDAIVEYLHPDQYNNNTSLAENILFGLSKHEEFSVENLTEHKLLRQLLDENDLAEALDNTAISAATTMVELFSGLNPGHEFYDRFSFIDTDDLVALKRILKLIEAGTAIDNLNVIDRKLIRSIPFRVISGRHRIGILEESEKEKILQIRTLFASKLDEKSLNHIHFFSPDNYNALTSVGENIIFGRIVYGKLGAEEKVYSLILEVLKSMDLMSPILEIGLAAPVGLAGSQLTASQRQKIVLARGLIKQPKVLVINEGLSALDTDETNTILANVKQKYPQLGVLWVDNQFTFQTMFDRVVYMQSGKIVKDDVLLPKADKLLPSTSTLKAPVVRSAQSLEDNEKFTLVKGIPLFRTLDETHLLFLAENCEMVDLARGERLFNQGDPGDALYIIASGKANVLITAGGQEHIIKECGVNEFIGELALLSHEPRSASVEATTELAVLKLKRDVFVELLKSNGDIGHQILQIITQRQVDNNRKMKSLIQS